MRKTLPICALILMSMTGIACTSDLRDDSQDDAGQEDMLDDAGNGIVEIPTAGFIESDQFRLDFDNTEFTVVEGAGFVDFPISVIRTGNHSNNITMSVSGVTQTDNDLLTRQFTDTIIGATEQQTVMRLAVDIGPRPIMPHQRSVQISAIDTAGEISAQVLTLQVNPTSAPDVYLLIGQSNMVGQSEDDAKQSTPGGLDEPVSRINQLNVTFNDTDNFPNAAAFTNPDNLIDGNNPLTLALDPLHSGLESDGEKSGSRIGLGLSFAKRALADTTAEIYLVPAAWSDTGFCNRGNPLAGIGWNATARTDTNFSGTLLHDRAIARANMALDRTEGVLRGILWHQGEADSDNEVCASAYAQNLREMIQSLRTNIAEDARGAIARGVDADIPFIAGTMSMGGEQAPFSQVKLLVDSAHRTLATDLSYANHVNSDDLVPPVYPCGAGSCIHFGAAALREMGARYYEALISTLP